jgi:Mn-dependent DtxR family transcriptional regulator
VAITRLLKTDGEGAVIDVLKRYKADDPLPAETGGEINDPVPADSEASVPEKPDVACSGNCEGDPEEVEPNGEDDPTGGGESEGNSGEDDAGLRKCPVGDSLPVTRKPARAGPVFELLREHYPEVANKRNWQEYIEDSLVEFGDEETCERLARYRRLGQKIPHKKANTPTPCKGWQSAGEVIRDTTKLDRVPRASGKTEAANNEEDSGVFFAVVPRKMLEKDSGLKPYDPRVYSAVRLYVWGDRNHEKWDLSVKAIAEMVGLSEAQVRLSRDRLIAAGWLHCEHRRGGSCTFSVPARKKGEKVLKVLREFVLNRRLSHVAFRVYLELLKFLHKGSFTCYPAEKTLAGTVGVTTRSVRRALATLEEIGYVKRIRKGRANVYEFPTEIRALMGVRKMPI